VLPVRKIVPLLLAINVPFGVEGHQIIPSYFSLVIL